MEVFQNKALILPLSDIHRAFQGGTAYRQNLVHKWLDIVHRWRPNAPDYETNVIDHEGYSSYWSEVTLSNASNVNFPAIHWAGWYDIFLQMMLDSYQLYQTNSAQGGRGKQQLIVGPRGHCMFEDYIDFEWDWLGDKWAYDISVDLFESQVKGQEPK